MWLQIILALVLLLLVAKGIEAATVYFNSQGMPLPDLAAWGSAVAKAEGWFVEGSLPRRMQNPGALRLHGETDTITQFPSAEAGWDALYNQLARIFAGQSPYYSPDMSIYQMAEVWTGGDNPIGWATTVAQTLGVSPDATLQSTLGG